jgi:hypothetical protein
MPVTLEKFSYAYIPGNKPGDRIGVVSFGETGYYPVRDWDQPAMTEAQVVAFVNRRNALIGVPEEVALSMFHASMFGWSAPCADIAKAHFKPAVKA